MSTRKLTVTDLWRGKAIVPELRLCGKWLKQAGFNRGHRVEISFDEDAIIIRKVK